MANIDKANAAREILAHLDRGGNIFEDFSFRGDSPNVGRWNDEIADEYYAAGHDFPGNLGTIKDFLRQVIRDNATTSSNPSYGGGGTRPPEQDDQERNPFVIPDDQVWQYIHAGTDTSVTWSPVAPNIPIEVQVRAVDRYGNASGWSSSTRHLTADDDVPPPVPTKATIVSYLGVLKISWDGKGVL